MGWYLYCIGPPGLPLPGLPGLDEAPLRLVPVGSIVACVSARAASPEPTLARVRRHHEVIRAATTEVVTPLPVRFGQWLDSTESLRERLRRQEDALRRSLSDVRGALEFTVRVWDAATGPPAPEAAAGAAARHAPEGESAARVGAREGVDPAAGAANGTAFMRSLARRYGDQRAVRELGVGLARELRRALGSLVRSERVEEPASLASATEPLVAVAHLVPVEHASRYGDEARRYAAARPALRLEVYGPYPPYSFVR